jgi:hypothetical protein
MPQGKPAGVPCIHLEADLRCGIFGDPARPRVCGSLAPEPAMCGSNREHALAFLEQLERRTCPR